jgi:hypothetical protein
MNRLVRLARPVSSPVARQTRAFASGDTVLTVNFTTVRSLLGGVDDARRCDSPRLAPALAARIASTATRVANGECAPAPFSFCARRRTRARARTHARPLVRARACFSSPSIETPPDLARLAPLAARLAAASLDHFSQKASESRHRARLCWL